MKLSAVGNTNAILFEPENAKEAKKLNNYVENKKFLETKTGKTNFGVAVGTLGLSYTALAISALAKKKSIKIANTIVAFAGLATSIGFCIKNALDFKKFKNPPAEQPAEKLNESQVDLAMHA